MAKKSKSKTFENLINWINKSERLSRCLNGVLAALVVVMVLGAAVAGLKQLEKYVNHLPVFTASEVSVCLYSQPAWMSDALAKEILKESFKPIHAQLVAIHREGRDLELPRVLGDQLRKNAWVNKVTGVSRSYGGQFVINCEFRDPTALVNMKEWCYLIDDEGYLLPGKYKYNALTGCGMLEIHGCQGPVPATGDLWAGEDLQAGLGLVKFLKDVPFKSQIRAVDVSNYKSRTDPLGSWITLLTDRGTYVRWGKPVGEERGLENSTAQKLALLAGIYHRTGHIDLGRSFVDIRRSPTSVDVPKIASTGRSATQE
jgi:hypothetical protein